MFAPVIFLALLAGVFSYYSTDLDCTMINKNGARVFAPNATDCQDTVEPVDICDQLFNYGIPYNPTLAPEFFERPNRCYTRMKNFSNNQDIKDLAVSLCPRYCGYCCLRKTGKKTTPARKSG